MIALRVQNLTKKFNQKVIFEDLSFTHSEGILGIAGANGSGKSTLMKSLAYLLRLNSGKIEWSRDGKFLEQNEVKDAIGFSAPYINLYTELTVLENLRFLIEVSGVSADESYLQEILEHVHISKMAQQLYGSLSTGQQQRVKLASALLRNPDILFLDEPGSNLDKKGQTLVTQIVQNASANGTLVIVASNNPDEINLCDQLVELTL